MKLFPVLSNPSARLSIQKMFTQLDRMHLLTAISKISLFRGLLAIFTVWHFTTFMEILQLRMHRHFMVIQILSMTLMVF